jgi:hypothetical protein
MRKLGQSNLAVSQFCLGTTTFAARTRKRPRPERLRTRSWHQRSRHCGTLSRDPSAETAGDTERIIGQQLSKNGRRQEVILASKILGSGNFIVCPPKSAPIGPETLRVALETSLRKLRTEYWTSTSSTGRTADPCHFDARGQIGNLREECREILRRWRVLPPRASSCQANPGIDPFAELRNCPPSLVCGFVGFWN